MAEIEFEEEEFTTEFTGNTLRRILAQVTPHWPWVAGFLATVAVVSVLDSFFTYLGKQIIDVAIVPGDRAALFRFIGIYGALILVQSVMVFGFIYLAGILGERVQ